MKLILKDGTEYNITDFTSSSFLMNVPTFLEAVNVYNTIVFGDNLSNVSVVDGENTVFSATDLVSDGIQITPMTTGYSAIFFYHGAKAASADSEYAEVGRILLGEE